MHLDPVHARTLLSRVDLGRVRSGRAVGLRDGALLALVAAGLNTAEIATLHATAIQMHDNRVMVSVERHGIPWFTILPTDLGARLLVWLSESRLWALPERVFHGPRGPLTQAGVCKVLRRYRDHRPARPLRRAA